MMQGTEETRRALEDLREYCSSPGLETGTPPPISGSG